jgi:hypothetical protein
VRLEVHHVLAAGVEYEGDLPRLAEVRVDLVGLGELVHPYFSIPALVLQCVQAATGIVIVVEPAAEERVVARATSDQRPPRLLLLAIAS